MITLIALFSAWLFTIAFSAPTLDAATLSKNGEDAQKLNAFFLTLNETDTCTSGTQACISGNLASCQNAKWSTQNCTASKMCFALPSVIAAGTFVDCTSEQTAFFLIDNTGAVGGIFGSNSTSTDNNTNPEDCDDGDEVTTTLVPTSSIPQPTETQSSPQQVTVTITLSGPTTLAPVTSTLSPQEASSVLSSLISGGATVIQGSSPSSVVPAPPASIITPTPTPTPAPY